MSSQPTDISDLGNITAPRQAGLYVRKVRESKSLTRGQLAAKAGVSERLLASLELGDATGIRLDKLLAVLGTLGITLTAKVAQDNQNEGTPQTQLHAKGNVAGTPSQIAAPTPGPSPTYAELFTQIAREQGVAIKPEGRP